MVKIVKASEYQVASVKKGTSDKLQKDLFWMRFVSPKHQEMLVNMNETEADIIQWSKKRVLYCSVFALFGLMILMFHMFGKLGFQVGIGLIIFALIYSILSFSTTSPFNKSGINDNLEKIDASFKIKILAYPTLFSSNIFLSEK